MPAPPDIPITITHPTAFALPCPVPRGITYLSDPSILLGALPSVERVVMRQRGTYRLTLAPIRFFNHAFRPAAEVTLTTTDERVTIQSISEEPFARQGDEILTRVDGTLRLTAIATGSDVRGALRLTATIPARTIPPLMPRMLAHRTAERLLGLRLRQEMQAMARTLSAGFAAWDAEQQPVTSGQ